MNCTASGSGSNQREHRVRSPERITLNGVLTVGQMRRKALDLRQKRLGVGSLLLHELAAIGARDWLPLGHLWRHSTQELCSPSQSPAQSPATYHQQSTKTTTTTTVSKSVNTEGDSRFSRE